MRHWIQCHVSVSRAVECLALPCRLRSHRPAAAATRPCLLVDCSLAQALTQASHTSNALHAEQLFYNRNEEGVGPLAKCSVDVIVKTVNSEPRQMSPTRSRCLHAPNFDHPR